MSPGGGLHQQYVEIGLERWGDPDGLYNQPRETQLLYLALANIDRYRAEAAAPGGDR